MTFNRTPLEGVYTIEPAPFEDERGWFTRIFCKKEFQAIGDVKEWVQVNHSYTRKAGTLRGMHFQHPPFAEVKLIHCIRGNVFDVAVDLRENSATFLHWFGVELSAENKKMIYIPAGFAHGFLTLEDDCELIYHHSSFYTPGGEGSIRYDDPNIGIEWPREVTLTSEKDASAPDIDKNFKGLKI